jgi:FixJ family two-component response regulator
MNATAARPRTMIAVVDDDKAVCSSLKFMLEIEGYVARTYDTPTRQQSRHCHA